MKIQFYPWDSRKHSYKGLFVTFFYKCSLGISIFSYAWCYLKSKCWRSPMLKQKAARPHVLEFGLGLEQSAFFDP